MTVDSHPALAMASQASAPSLQCDMSSSRKPRFRCNISPIAAPPRLSSPFQARDNVVRCRFSLSPSARAAAPEPQGPWMDKYC